MNFNLISPPGNGYEYTIRFREPIDIPAKSKIAMNWAELTRAGKIVLKDPATITITSGPNNVFPRKVPDGAFPDNLIFSNQTSSSTTVSVGAGTYNFAQLAEKIDQALQLGLGTSTHGNLNYYEPNDDSFSFLLEPGNNILQVGYELGGEWDNQTVANVRSSFDFSTSPNLAAKTTTGGATRPFAYLKDKAGTNGTFDSFATDFSKHYFHYQYFNETNTYVQQNLVFLRGSAVLKPGGTGGAGGQAGRIIFGLYSKEYAEGVGIGAHPRTASGLANTISLDANGIPRNFINIISDKIEGNFTIQMATNNAGLPIEEWQSIGDSIHEMTDVYSVPMTSLFGANETPQYCFHTYIETRYDDLYKTRPKIFFRVYKSSGGTTAGDLIFDSRVAGHFLPYSLLEAEVGNPSGIAYTNATEINSQIPFNISLYADTDDEGWRVCRFKSFKKDLNPGGTLSNPQTIIEKYTLTFSGGLETVLGTSTAELRPNAVLDRNAGDFESENLKTVSLLYSNLDVNWKLDSYAIFLDLPINNYKNTDTASQGGFAKTILANLPNPFAVGEIIEPNSTGTTEVLSVYQPYQQIIHHMNNNNIKVNSIRVKIVKMGDETLSSELSKSIVNFTIIPPG
jgi:hypothetical protein